MRNQPSFSKPVQFAALAVFSSGWASLILMLAEGRFGSGGLAGQIRRFLACWVMFASVPLLPTGLLALVLYFIQKKPAPEPLRFLYVLTWLLFAALRLWTATLRP